MVNRRKQERYAMAAQLVSGRDDDLIKWLLSLEHGNRSGAIKAAVRRGLGFRQPESPEPGSDLVTQEDIIELKQELNLWADDITAHLKHEMLRTLQAMVNNGSIGSLSALPPENGTIDEQRKAKRGKRIKQAQW